MRMIFKMRLWGFRGNTILTRRTASIETQDQQSIAGSATPGKESLLRVL
jgi:hypothetical protein